MTLCQKNETNYDGIHLTLGTWRVRKLFDAGNVFLCSAICVKNLYLKDKLNIPQAASRVTYFVMRMRKRKCVIIQNIRTRTKMLYIPIFIIQRWLYLTFFYHTDLFNTFYYFYKSNNGIYLNWVLRFYSFKKCIRRSL